MSLVFQHKAVLIFIFPLGWYGVYEKGFFSYGLKWWKTRSDVQEIEDSYMSAHVCLTLLNELRKSNKIQGWSSISSLFSQQVH